MISFGNEGIAVADEQASNTVRRYNVAQKLHVLEDAFVYGAVSELVYDNADFDQAYEKMMKVSSNSKKFDRLLRGYKE
jgi:hypothetical protein